MHVLLAHALSSANFRFPVTIPGNIWCISLGGLISACTACSIYYSKATPTSGNTMPNGLDLKNSYDQNIIGAVHRHRSLLKRGLLDKQEPKHATG
ncbi:hypothetical protein I7I53_06899 [Histoplasma capsulatum var. duboisii H88]|uniref:Transmembrane protein n=2 Tax=Ajellomyces capsulatus TaxID=5037 RepID=A0A8H8D7L4_AJECA|nr:hypothetical protein I7I52_02131 [Histoplasma capsulatum]QSS51546.1 hypothetical protein I7I53_06899 [Histoplasma capsulatum var. duboisii H88]QSS69563.1 hypothetical protein I7I50_10893 [Histoplasma capsulatum G186AR]